MIEKYKNLEDYKNISKNYLECKLSTSRLLIKVYFLNIDEFVRVKLISENEIIKWYNSLINYVSNHQKSASSIKNMFINFFNQKKDKKVDNKKKYYNSRQNTLRYSSSLN